MSEMFVKGGHVQHYIVYVSGMRERSAAGPFGWYPVPHRDAELAGGMPVTSYAGRETTRPTPERPVITG